MKRTVARALQILGVVAGSLLALALRRSRATAREPPLSPVTAEGYVGPEFVERQKLTTDEEPPDKLADVAHFAGEAFDPARLHPEVRRFYERTDEYEMRYRVQWHRPFRTGAALASRLTSRIEQLNLPPPGDESWHQLESRFVDIAEPGSIDGDAESVRDSTDPAEPTREDVRGWVRTDPETGEAVFVALYATHHRDGEGFVNISVPVPGGGVDTVLRPENLELSGDERTGTRLTTEGAGDPGLYLRMPLGPFAVPGGQTFDVRLADGSEGGEPKLRAIHQMWLFGRTFLTVEYDIERVD